jgi:outer membrane lipase/esterase
MSFNWLRRALVLAACAVPALLASCGGGTVESKFTPDRVVAFGDGFSDLGQRGTRYTVNDGSINIWTQQVASSYGRPLVTAAAGGTSYATGNARVTAKPDAAGDASTSTITEQIDTFLSGQSFTSGDLVIVSGGIADVVAEVGRVNAGAQTTDAARDNVKQAGRDLAAQVRRVVQAGGKHVMVAGSYNLGKSPWALGTGQSGLLGDLSSRFNEELLISMVDLGNNVLYVDAALHFNLVVNGPATYQLSDVTSAVCTSVDPGPGIGTGPGQVNSALCTPATVQPGADPALFLFADGLYPTPQGHRLFGNYAVERFRNRF